MLLLSKLHSGLTLVEATEQIRNYPEKKKFEITKYERDTVLSFQEKTGALMTNFKVTFCREKFATMDGAIDLKKSLEPYFNQIKEAYEAIRTVGNSNYGSPFSSRNQYSSYAELQAANPSKSMTSGRSVRVYVAQSLPRPIVFVYYKNLQGTLSALTIR